MRINNTFTEVGGAPRGGAGVDSIIVVEVEIEVGRGVVEVILVVKGPGIVVEEDPKGTPGAAAFVRPEVVAGGDENIPVLMVVVVVANNADGGLG